MGPIKIPISPVFTLIPKLAGRSPHNCALRLLYCDSIALIQRFQRNITRFPRISLGATALTLCAFYSINAKWVINEDWIALMDVVPTMTRNFWVLTVLSVIINSVTLFLKTDR